MRRLASTFVVGLLWASTATAQAVLDFTGLNLANHAPIPQSYGDNLDPNVVDIQYRTISPIDGSVLADALSAWDFNYGDLEHVAFPTTDGYVGEIAFVPAPDHAIHLVSFDLAGWFRVDRPITVLRLLDAAGNILFDFAANGPITIQGDGNGPQHSSFSPDFYHVGVLRLQWGTDWDVGLDNLRFEGVHFTAIPEPSTTALLVLGGVSLVLVHLRSRRTRRH